MAHRYLEFLATRSSTASPSRLVTPPSAARAKFLAATAIASVAATVFVAAQAQTTSARPEDGRAVTAIGCLKQERDIHGRMTTGDEAGKSGDGFVLMNARITSASMPEAPITSDPATAGSASAAAAERERRTEPSGAPGAGGAGTSGTGSTSVQTTERPANESARGGATAANPAPVPGRDTIYKLVGLSDAELTPLLGKEVEVRATLDANTMGSAALRQPGATMGREPASTPSASTPPEPTQAPATTADRQDTTPPASRLPELKATSIKTTGGRCQGT
jgi:hypothetical protein